ncbi:TetR family transcriptional regulator [Nocardia sp. NPDC051030]|uniref:TetR/AcrR family transcriptional regulator n=1 Tax=Nocardia sp. NPDC051030 TaxID=3155162 RepID=UPI0034225702
MSRWEPNASGRLQQAALELYSSNGFESTTVAEIAKRAGLTERTFFRHFTDKREVLFGGAGALQDLLVSTVHDAPAALPPIEVIALALHAAAGIFEDRADFARTRQAIIAANAELQARELIKLATLGAALAEALRSRGSAEPAASLAAETGIAVLRVAFERWTAEPGRRGLSHFIDESMDELKLVAAGR